MTGKGSPNCIRQNVHRAFFYFRVFVIDHPPPCAAPTEEMPPLEGEEDEDASRMEEVD